MAIVTVHDAVQEHKNQMSLSVTIYNDSVICIQLGSSWLVVLILPTRSAAVDTSDLIQV